MQNYSQNYSQIKIMETKYFVVSNHDCDSIAIIQLVGSDFSTFNNLLERALKEHFIDYEKIKFKPIGESIFSHEIELDCFENEDDRISTTEEVTLTQTELYKPGTETAEVSFENESRKVVNQMLETLEKFLISETIVNQNVIDYINHDIDYVTVNYLGHKPDGDNEAKLFHGKGMSDIDAIHLLSTRICNTLQTI